jgi:DNA-binding beta-propeller fold protein YncE
VLEGWPQWPRGANVQEVVAVATDHDGCVYVFNRGTMPIMTFDRQGHFLRSFEVGPWARPHGITVGADNTVYCVDDFDHTVRVFSPGGQPLLTLGTSGVGSRTGAEGIDYRTIKRAGPPFNYPTNLAVAPLGELLVTDGYGNARVHRFSARGVLLSSWGEPGVAPGQFHVPHGIAIDSKGVVYVADRENSRIQRFTLEGEFIDEWTDVVRPSEVFVAGDGTVYVAELGNRAGRWPGWPDTPADAVGGRLSIFDSQGGLLARWGGGESPCAAGDFFAPHDVWVDKFGDIYVSEVVWSAGANRGLVSPACHTLQKFARLEGFAG